MRIDFRDAFPADLLLRHLQHTGTIRNEPAYLWHARAGLIWQPRPTKRFEGKQTAPLRICCVWLYVLY